MSAINNRKTVILGLFVFFGIAIIVTAILTLGGQKKSFVRAFHINAVFKDVNGLAIGNNVWVSGVKVGTIKSIEFTPDANVNVQMSIEEKIRKYIAEDAKVKISSDGLIGNKIIIIYGGTPGAARAREHTVLGVETALNPEELMNTLQANNKNLLSITNDFKVITDRLANGKGSVGKLLTDETLFNELRSAMTGLKQASVRAGSITSDLSDYTSRLKEKGTLADDLVSDTVIFSRLRATVKDINDIAVKANTVVDGISGVAAKLNSSKSPVGVLLNDEAAAGDLKATLRNLQSGTEKLDENMEALQHNFLLRGFFRRKAREEKKNATEASGK